MERNLEKNIMDFGKRGQGFLYLDRNKFDLYEEGFSTVATFPFDQNVVRDLELIDEVQLQAQIVQFLTQNTIPPANIVVVLSPAIVFEKDFQTPPTAEEIGKFIDTVPFEEIFTTTFPIENGTKIIAGNKNLYECLTDAFSQAGSLIVSAVPYIVFGQEYMLFNSLDGQNAAELLKRVDSIKNFNLNQPAGGQNSTPRNLPKEQTEKKTSKTRIYVLVGIFAFLILVLIFMLVRQ